MEIFVADKHVEFVVDDGGGDYGMAFLSFEFGVSSFEFKQQYIDLVIKFYMATIKRFEDIETWQKARVLANEIHVLAVSTELAKDYRLKDQINASAGSTMDNIAEGFERVGKLEFINFLSIAKGSAGEVKSQLYRLSDRMYVNKEKFDELYKLSDDICNMLGAWINYLNKSGIKGTKFKDRLT